MGPIIAIQIITLQKLSGNIYYEMLNTVFAIKYMFGK